MASAGLFFAIYFLSVVLLPKLARRGVTVSIWAAGLAREQLVDGA